MNSKDDYSLWLSYILYSHWVFLHVEVVRKERKCLHSIIVYVLLVDSVYYERTIISMIGNNANWHWPGIEIDLDFFAMDMLLWQVFGIPDFFTNETPMWKNNSDDCTDNYMTSYDASCKTAFCWARQRNVPSIHPSVCLSAAAGVSSGARTEAGAACAGTPTTTFPGSTRRHTVRTLSHLPTERFPPRDSHWEIPTERFLWDIPTEDFHRKIPTENSHRKIPTERISGLKYRRLMRPENFRPSTLLLWGKKKQKE